MSLNKHINLIEKLAIQEFKNNSMLKKLAKNEFLKYVNDKQNVDSNDSKNIERLWKRFCLIFWDTVSY